MLWLTILIILLSIIALFTTRYYKQKHSYWKNLQVETPKYYYFVGNILEQFLYKKNLGLIVTDAYNKFKGYNYFGFYNSTQPSIIVRNPEIIKDILVKDFNSFHDNDFDSDETDAISGKNPFTLNGDRWKTTRNQITPSFTTYKTKLMMPLLNQNSTKLLNYLETASTSMMDAKLFAIRITSENVASCAFGIDGGCYMSKKDADYYEGADKFFRTTQQLLCPTSWDCWKNFIIYLCPPMKHVFQVNVLFKEAVEFLQNIVAQSLQYREKHEQIKRNDFLDSMTELHGKINDDSIFNMTDIFGHCAGFLIDGIETSANVLSHALYELGRCKDVQDKIRNEIAETKSISIDEFMTYEQVKSMKYLDCFFHETLRLHPPFFMMTKRVTRPYTLMPMREDGTGPEVTLEVGTPVIIPFYGLHVDENHHRDAKSFKPERFLDQNKDTIDKFTYLPFGEGPRVCLGKKFGMLQTKLALITIIQHYAVSINAKTKEPIQADPSIFVNSPLGGYWIDLKKLH